ncbi:MAG TPA: FliA/WhiG family RNA polymerase sigma factor [Clostridiaceae bacterium]|nr:FliA/WhiG family RNA polymerase sigma factor [Clostridiaceae bacterium]
MGYKPKEPDHDQIMRYLPLVKRIAGRMDAGDGDFDKDDLFSIGVIGLIDALKKFDASKGVPFEAYATVRIKGSIIDEMRKSGRVSRDRIAKLNEYYDAKERLEQQHHRTPEEQEICAEMGIGDKELSKLHETVHYLSRVSFETTLFHKDGNEVQLSDLIKDEDTATPEEELLKKERKLLLRKAMKELNEREQIILDLYYVQELTLKEIAYSMDISIPRVSQIHGKILLKLRALMA